MHILNGGYSAVQAVAGHQLPVRSLLNEPAAVEDKDAVRLAERRNAVRDQEGDAIVPHIVQRAPDGGIRLRIDGAHGVVENQDGRFLHQRARNGHALLLPARQRDAALTDDRVVALLERFDDIVNGRDARNLFDEVKSNLAARLAEEGGTVTPQQRKTIMMEDVL